MVEDSERGMCFEGPKMAAVNWESLMTELKTVWWWIYLPCA